MHEHTEAGESKVTCSRSVCERECVSKAKCEKHYWHVSGSMVMCAYRIGRARGVAAEVVDVVTAFLGAVLDICGVF